ncbi:septum formation family protein [Nocardioides panacisoli]|uniref:septum formation family protein n=1 Tax=Nocardioides panacisoli TaxID=627624 RepID=UPI001C62EA80|nr:septum formation family protein [Nocardioides panacisoli]QYJ05034.1 septum formation family protein [Nocardioides panacisoli]
MSDLTPPGHQGPAPTGGGASPPPPPGAGAPPPPPPPPAPPSAYAGPEQPRRDTGLAWTSLALSALLCLPLSPLVGMVLAVVALVRRRAAVWVPGLALIIGLVCTALQVDQAVRSFDDLRDGVQQGLRDAADREAEEAREGEGDGVVSTLRVEPGDCLDDPTVAGMGDELVETDEATLVPCEDPHDFEAFAQLRMADGDFPGQPAIDEESRACFEEFETFVGAAYADSDLELYLYFPTESSWDLFGDRTITCLVGLPGDSLRGSMAGTER